MTEAEIERRLYACFEPDIPFQVKEPVLARLLYELQPPSVEVSMRIDGELVKEKTYNFIIATERERCAKIADRMQFLPVVPSQTYQVGWSQASVLIRDLIRRSAGGEGK